MDGPSAVVCRGLTKRFAGGPGGVLAVDGLDLDVPAGSVFGLLGPNGAGKTTTLRLVTGLARPTAGRSRSTGAGRPGRRGSRGGIGVLDQDPRYYGWMSGRELVEFAGRLQGLDDRRRRGSGRARRWRWSASPMRPGGGWAATRAGCASGSGSPRRSSRGRGCSSSTSRSARSIPEGRRDLLALIADLRASATVIFSTHVLADVERICDRVGIMAAGRLVTEGPLDELLGAVCAAALPDRARAGPGGRRWPGWPRRSATVPWVDGVTEDGGRLVVSVTDEAAASAGLLPLVVEAGLRLAAFERVRPSLEDVFLRLVGREAPAA